MAPPDVRLEGLLRGDEEIRWRRKPRAAPIHVRHVALALVAAVFLVGSVGVLILIGLIETGTVGLDLFATMKWTLVLLVSAPLAAAALTAHLRHRRSVYAVTDGRALVLGGAVGGKLNEIPWEEVRDVQVVHGILDLLFGTGTIHVRADGDERSPEVAMPYVVDADRQLERIQEVAAGTGPEERERPIQIRSDATTLEEILDPDEEVLWHARPDPAPVPLSSAIGAAVLLVFTFFAVTLPLVAFGWMWLGLGGLTSPYTLAVTALVALAVLGYMTLAALRYPEHGEFAATDRRLIVFDGVFGRKVTTVDWEDVESVDLHVGFADGRYGTGRIGASVGERSNVYMHNVPEPHATSDRLRGILDERGEPAENQHA